jgi:hypothetical protein
MQRLLLAAGALALTAGCVGFEHERNLVTPGAPTLPSTPSGGSGSLTGTWSSIAPLAIPNSWSCGSFQWAVTSETPSSLAGEFYAICAGVVLVQGRASGELNGSATEVALGLTGTATVQSVISCPFTLTGTGYVLDADTLRIPYSGTTCLGPVHGEETLRRPASPDGPPPPPPAPPPIEPPAPPPSDNPHHVGPGPLTAARAQEVVQATGREFPHLTAPPGTEQEGVERAEELLLRAIWHLKLAGYDAARQRNPSGAISNDKLNVFHDGRWQAYDIFQDLGRPGVPIRIIFLPISGANPIAYPGIAD